MATLAEDRAKIVDSIASKTSDLEKSEEALAEAHEAVTSVRAEIAREVAPNLPAPTMPQECVAAIQGLISQLDGLPSALPDNAMAALQAIGTQAQAVSRLMGLESSRPMQVNMDVGFGGNSRPTSLHTSGRRGTSPGRRSSCAESQASSGSSRSRSQDRSRARRDLAAAAVGTRKLEEMGFHRRAAADPYSAGEDAEGASGHTVHAGTCG